MIPSVRHNYCAALLGLILVACCTNSSPPGTGNLRTAGGEPESVTRLDMSNNRTVRVIDMSTDVLREHAFIEVRVGSVQNPARELLVFEVRHETDEASELLGTFSLYPADNPGTFLVATKQRLRPGSRLAVVLTTPDRQLTPSRNDKPVSVDIESVALRRR